MDTVDYVYNGKTFKARRTVLDNNTFFHAAFGVRTAQGDAYFDKKAKSRRCRWASFLTYFENEPMPSPLADVMNKCLAANNKYEQVRVEDQGCLEGYISDITKAEQDVTVEEIPVLAALENIKVILLINGRSDPLIINSVRGILGSYSSNEHFKGEVLLRLDGKFFSRLNPIEASFSRSLEDVAVDAKEDGAITEQFDIGWKKYNKESDSHTGIEGEQFQVGLLTVFFLNALRKLSNWRLSTENTAAGKFDDVVLEWPEGATLLQAKHKQSKTKKITLDDLTSANSENDDFSLPKYFLSFEEIKKAFPLANLIVCTNVSMDGKAMTFLDAKAVPFESMLHCNDNNCKVYTFNDNILPYLKDGVKSYYENIPRNKDVDVSTIITDENIKDFLQRLQFYSEYPAGNDIEKVTEQLLLHLKSSKSPYGEFTPLEIHTKILEWFRQKDGVHQTTFTAKGIFSEIYRDRIWQNSEKYNMFFRENLMFQTPAKIFHLITEGGFHLLQELRIFQVLQKDKHNVLYIKADDAVEAQRQTIDAFHLPKYTTLLMVWPEIMEQSVKEEIGHKLGRIFSKFTSKRVILVADRSNTLPQELSHCNCELINEAVSFYDLATESQKMLLEKKCVTFQGTDVTLRELLATQASEDCGTLLDSEVLEKLTRGEKIKIGVSLSDLNVDVAHCYIKRTFKRISGLTLSEEAICQTKETIILISDDAGSGKSTVLTSLAANIKKTNPQLWVIRINLNNYTDILKTHVENKKSLYISDLLNSKYSTRFMNDLEKSVFSMDEKVVVLLDGFDEISPDFTALALSLLSVCRGQRNFAKLIVTTRPYMAKELETTLQVTPYVLERFESQNQTDLLTRYWVHNLHVTNTEKSKCKQYAEALMKRMSMKRRSPRIKSDQQISNSFAAIPLHVRMLAEIFQENDLLDESADWEGCKEFLTADRLEPKLSDNMNVTRLYKIFIKKKRKLFLDKENPRSNTAENQALINQFEDCLACHRCLALELILKKEECQLFSCYRQTPESLKTNILKIGIIQKLDPLPLFIHKTFATYFVAESIVEELKLPNRNVNFQKLLVEEFLTSHEASFLTLRESSFEEAKVFFDSFLQHVVEVPSTIFREYQATSYPIFSSLPKLDLLHDLAEDGFVSILKLVLNCMDSNCKGPNCVAPELLLRYPPPHRRIDSNVLKFLHNRTHMDGLNFTSICRGYTLLEHASTKGRLEMVKFLVERGADVNMFRYKPAHLALLGGHVDVLKFLVEQGAEIKTLDPTDSPEYIAIQKNYKVIAAYLLKGKLEAADSETKDPLIAYTAAYLGRADVLEEQVRRGLDVNSRVDQDETLVFGAARGEQPEIIRYLVRQGCDVNARDLLENTALLKSTDASTFQLLAELGTDVNAANRNAETALLVIVPRFDSNLVEVLVRKGANVNFNDNEGRTSLHKAFDQLPKPVNLLPDEYLTKLRTIRLLMEHGGDANIKDHNGDTPLHLAVASCLLDAVALLLEYEIDVNVRDKGGRTALHLAVSRHHADIVMALVQHNADVTAEDNNGFTALYLSLRHDRADIAKFLLQHSPDTNLRDNSNQTTLHHLGPTNHFNSFGNMLDIRRLSRRVGGNIIT